MQTISVPELVVPMLSAFAISAVTGHFLIPFLLSHFSINHV